MSNSCISVSIFTGFELFSVCVCVLLYISSSLGLILKVVIFTSMKSVEKSHLICFCQMEEMEWGNQRKTSVTYHCLLPHVGLLKQFFLTGNVKNKYAAFCETHWTF